MSNQSTNTASRPSYAFPECPRCETNVLVDAVDYAAGKYYCHKCDDGFEATGAFTPPDHSEAGTHTDRGGEGKGASHARDCPYCDEEDILLPYHLPCAGVNRDTEVFDL